MIPTDNTFAHLDGFRVVSEMKDDRLRIVIRLVTKGEPNSELFPDVVLFEAPRTPETEVAHDRAYILANAMCAFTNSGGRKEDLFLLVDKFCSQIPDVVATLKLITILPPPGGNLLIWRLPDGQYLKVQEGEEGFTEFLSEQELQEVLKDHATSYSDDSDWF